jgi:hypothetical protein
MVIIVGHNSGDEKTKRDLKLKKVKNIDTLFIIQILVNFLVYTIFFLCKLDNNK